MLKKKDASRLSELENVIEQGIRAAYETGRALHEIKSERLYKEVGFPAFEAYCKQRWGITPQHANRMIDYFENVSLTLKSEPNGSVLDDSVINRANSNKPTLCNVPEYALRPVSALRRKDESAAVEVLKSIEAIVETGEEVTEEVVKQQIRQVEVISDEECSPPEDKQKQKLIHFKSESSEHYTPQKIIDLVLDFFEVEQIDLDPCSNSKKNPNFPAKRVFTKEDDGLSQAWIANTLFMNPPYGREIDDWVSKLGKEYEAGNVKEALALVPARTDTKWFDKLHGLDVCFVRGRLTFVNNGASAPFPSALVYLGNRSDDFCNHFSAIGSVRPKSVSKDFSEWSEDEEDLDREAQPEGGEGQPRIEELLLEDGRKLYISHDPEKIPRFNRTNAMIGWAGWTWNPITGCWHGCKYCYARDLSNRFYKTKFEPTFHPDRLLAPAHTKVPKEAETDPTARNVFVCSMADLFGKWVPDEWILQVFQSVIDNPQWNFLFLTKFPQRLQEINDLLGGFPDNAWVGTTVDEQQRVKVAEKAFRNIQAKVKWLSCEPLLERLTFNSLEMFDWVVVGGQSASSQTKAFQPPLESVVHLLNQAIAAKCKVYWKDNLETPKQCPW